MKLCLISDVHANGPALETVLNELDSVDRVVHAGDIVGYGPHPNEVISKFKKTGIESIGGNHDRAVVRGDTNSGTSVMNESTKWTVREITDSGHEYLADRPNQLTVDCGEVTVQFTHGSYRDLDEYIYPTDLTMDFFDGVDDSVDVLVSGHTHYQLVTRVDGLTYINPGSVGLPRDGGSGACYALYDTENKNIQLHRKRYDSAQVATEILNRGVPDAAAEILKT